MATKANNDGTAKRGRKNAKQTNTPAIVLGLTPEQQREKIIEAAVSLRKFDGAAMSDEAMLTDLGACKVTFGGVSFFVKGYMPDPKNGQAPKVYSLMVMGKNATFGMAKIAPFVAQLPPDSVLKLKACAFMAWNAAGGIVTPEMGCEIATPKGGKKASTTSPADASGILTF